MLIFMTDPPNYNSWCFGKITKNAQNLHLFIFPCLRSIQVNGTQSLFTLFLSKPQPNLNTTVGFLSKPQPNPNLNTTVGFDMKMTLQTPPTHHTNFSGTSRRARELKFGTDTH